MHSPIRGALTTACRVFVGATEVPLDILFFANQRTALDALIPIDEIAALEVHAHQP